MHLLASFAHRDPFAATPADLTRAALPCTPSCAAPPSHAPVQADKQGSLLHPDGRALISLLPVTYSTPVDRELWVAAVFTHDGKHVLGASASSKHRIHIWSNSGEPVAVLEGGWVGGMGRGWFKRRGVTDNK